MANEGKIRASDLLDEKALILFRELKDITEENIKAIEQLAETNRKLAKAANFGGEQQLVMQQKILVNLKEIDRLRKEMIETELKMISTQESADNKRKRMHDAEISRIKKQLDDAEKLKKEEEKWIKDILAARTKAAKQAEAADNKRAAKFIADAKREADEVVKQQRRRLAARKATITAMSTMYLALEQVFRRIIAGWNKITNTLITLDNFRNLMDRLTGTTYEAADSMEYLIDISRRFGLNLEVATERYSKFYAAAKQSNLTMEETRDIFTSVSKVSGILGLRSHELSGVFLALEQMLSKGKVTTEELRRQLGERLPGAFGIMAKAVDVLNPKMVVTVENLDEMLKKGEIISKDVMPEFSRQLEIAFNATNVTRVETLAAAQTRFTTAITQLVYTLENNQGTLSNFFRGIYDGLTSNIDALTEWIELQNLTIEQERELIRLREDMESKEHFAGIWGDVGGQAAEAKKAYTDYMKAVKAQIKEDQKRNLLTEDYVKHLYNAGLEHRKLGDDKKEGLIVDGLIAEANAMEIEDLEEKVRLQHQFLEAKAEQAKFTVGTIEWLDNEIKKNREILVTAATMGNLDEVAIRNAQFRLTKLEAYRKTLATILGLEKERVKVTKEKKVKGIAPVGSIDENFTDIMVRKAAALKTEIKGLTEYEFERKKALQEQLDLIERQIAIERGSTTILGGAGKSPIIDNSEQEKKRDEYLAKREEDKNLAIQKGVELSNELFEIGNAIFDARIEQIQAEMDALDRFYDRKMLLARGDQEQELELELEKAAKMEELRQRELKERQKAAKFQKAQAITSAIINTALGITSSSTATPPFNLILMGLVAAIGAAQIATIVAAPLPQYKHGRKGGPAEWAITGDGGRSEYIAGNGGLVKTPNKPTLTYLNKGDKVLKDDRALENFISKTLLNDHNIHFDSDASHIEDAVVNGFKKAKVNNYIKMPTIKVSIDKELWINKNSQFGR